MSSNNFIAIEKDIDLMKNMPGIGVIQYPIINEQEFTVKGSTVYYPSIDFNNINLKEYNGYQYYDRSRERKIYHYLCNNILYRTDFFIRHWGYFTKNYKDHNSAEAGNINSNIFSFLSKWKYSKKISKILVKWLEKIIYAKSVIKNIAVTETMMNADVVHIGYYSTEVNVTENSDREHDVNQYGVVSSLSHLKVFNDINLLNSLSFKRYEKNK